MTIMSTNSTDNATTATDKTTVVKPQAPAAPAAPAAPVVKKNKFSDNLKFSQYKVVNLRLLKEGTIQYDPNYPELVLTSSAPEGEPMPLTAFFASRINQTLELVL